MSQQFQHATPTLNLDQIKASYHPNKRLSPRDIKKLFSPRMNQTSVKFNIRSTIPEILIKKNPGAGGAETPPQRDLSFRLDSETLIQKIFEKEKKMQKVLKKQMDLQTAIVKDKAEKNEEKRRKATKHVEDKNNHIDRLGHTAFRES